MSSQKIKLTIEGLLDTDAVQTFLDAIVQDTTSSNWKIFRKTITDDYIAFEYTIGLYRGYTAYLWTKIIDNRLEMGNVIPAEGCEMTYNDHNYLLDNLYTNLLKKYNSEKLTVTLHW